MDDELQPYLDEQLADPDFAAAYAAGRGPVPRRIGAALCWILGMPLIMAGMVGLAYALHGLALLCAWF